MKRVTFSSAAFGSHKQGRSGSIEDRMIEKEGWRVGEVCELNLADISGTKALRTRRGIMKISRASKAGRRPPFY